MLRRAITCTILRGGALTTGGLARRGAAATTPSVSQSIAVSGAPPKSAAPASAPADAGEPRRRHVCELATRPARPAQAGSERAPHREQYRREEQGGAGEAEFEEHLVVRLLRDQGAVAPREVARRLVREALLCVRQITREVLRRKLALPAGAEQRAIEEDACRRRTRRSSAGSSSPRTVLGAPAPGRTTAGESRARRCGVESVPAVTQIVTASVARTAPEPKAPAREGKAHHGGNRKIESEQAGQRRAENDPEGACDDRNPATDARPAGAGVDPGEADGEGHRRDSRPGRARRGMSPGGRRLRDEADGSPRRPPRAVYRQSVRRARRGARVCPGTRRRPGTAPRTQ